MQVKFEYRMWTLDGKVTRGISDATTLSMAKRELRNWMTMLRHHAMELELVSDKEASTPVSGMIMVNGIPCHVLTNPELEMCEEELDNLYSIEC